MDKISLRADCAKCSALCCMALAFDRSAMFAVDKPAGEACPHLDACGTCAIHPERVARGFQGCVNFDCLGAGQRTTQLLFEGRSWMDDRSLIRPMSRAFGQLLRAHEYLSLLAVAERLDLSPPDRETLVELRTALEDAGIQAETLDALQLQTDAFLSSLRSYVEGRTIKATA